MNNNMSLSDKYKREAKRNANLTKRHAELLKRLADKDRLIVQQDKVLGEARVELMELKQKLSGTTVERKIVKSPNKDNGINFPTLFKDIIKRNENKIRNLFVDKTRKHFMTNLTSIIDDFMLELENIPISIEDTLIISYEMNFPVKDILEFIERIKT